MEPDLLTISLESTMLYKVKKYSGDCEMPKIYSKGGRSL